MTPLEIIGASMLTVVMDFMKSGGINPKHEITIKDNKDEKEKVKKLNCQNKFPKTSFKSNKNNTEFLPLLSFPILLSEPI